MHPSEINAPSEVYILNGTDTSGNKPPTVASANEKVFYKISCSVAASIIVTGYGIFEFVASVANDAAAANYIDPLTGFPFASKAVFDDSDHGAGFYENIDTKSVTIAMVAGDEVYGRFKTIDTNGTTFKGIAYATSR